MLSLASFNFHAINRSAGARLRRFVIAKPVVVARAMLRDIAKRDVAQDRRARTLARIAIAGAAGEDQFDDLVRCRELHELAGSAIAQHVAVGVDDAA